MVRAFIRLPPSGRFATCTSDRLLQSQGGYFYTTPAGRRCEVTRGRGAGALAVTSGAALCRHQDPPTIEEGAMADTQISPDEMLKRIARFKDLMPMDYGQMKGGENVSRKMQGFTVIGHVTKAAPPIAG